MSHGGARPGAGRKPGKVNEATRKARELAAQYSEEAFRALVRVMRSKKSPENAVVSAATTILAYAHGKPKQSVEHSGEEGGPIELKVTRTLVRATVAPSA